MEHQDPSSNDVLLGQLLNEYLDRQAQGETVSVADLIARHPHLASEIRELIDSARQLRGDEDAIAQLLRQGHLQPPPADGYRAALGEYLIERHLGDGGMGIVLRAFDPRLRRTVALKVLRHQLADSPAALARFRREALAAARLNSPHIVTVYDVGRENSLPYILMEYVPGMNLARFIHERGPLEPDLARSIIAQVLTALTAAHEQQLVHRDVKSSNILLTGPELDRSTEPPAQPTPGSSPEAAPRLSAKLGDFGLVRIADASLSLTQDSNVVGTPEYMSPEQARGAGEVDLRSDVYSTGVVLYEMLTGQVPFRGDTPISVLRMIIDEPPPSPLEVNQASDPVLASIALKAMAKNPADRFGSAAEMLAALERNAPVPLAQRPRRPRRLLLLVGLALAALVAGWVWRPSATSWPPVRFAEVDPDTARVVRIRTGDNPEWTLVAATDLGVSLGDVALTKLEDGSELLIVGTHTVPTGSEETLFAFRRTGPQRWEQHWAVRLDLNGPIAGADDCGYLRVLDMVIGDLDEHPGPDVAVIANHPHRSPARLAVLDAATGKIRRSMWHAGQLRNLLLIPNGLDDGRPALLAHGVHNVDARYYLPCYDQALQAAAAPPPVLLPIILLVDPTRASGLWPLPAGQLDDDARPRGYAFIINRLPPGAYGADDDGALIEARGADALEFINILLDHSPDAPGKILIRARTYGGSHLILNRNLQCLRVELTDGTAIPDKQVWRDHYHVAVQNGRAMCPQP